MTLDSAYRVLLGLYPHDYRANFGGEMCSAFLRACRQRRGRGRAVFVRFLFTELVGLVAGAASEWFAKWTTDRITRARCLPDVRLMRPAGVTREDWFR